MASPSIVIALKDCFGSVACGPCDRSHVFTSSMRCSRELLQASRHQRVHLLAALLAFAPLALVLADALAPALLASDALVRADARPPHSLHLLLSRRCRQMPAPLHSLQCLLLCGACSRCIGLLPSPALAGATAADVRCLVRYSMQRAVPVFLLAARRAARRHSTALHG